MGGNLFPDNKRLNIKDYNKELAEVTELCTYYGLEVHSIPYLGFKESHGDLDLICNRKGLTIEHLLNVVQGKEYCINGKQVSLKKFLTAKAITDIDVLSFSKNSFQIDLIMIDDDSVDFAIKYHAFNDLGGVIGACIRPLGIRLSREGLYFSYEPVLSYGNHKIYLTKDFAEFCRIFEFDDSIYSTGLYGYNEMFSHLCKWKYFNSHYVSPMNMNATRKNRALKRTTFNELTRLAELQSGVVNYEATQETSTRLTSRFDIAHVERQMIEAHDQSSNLKKERESFNMERMERVLGYKPDGKVFQRISIQNGGQDIVRDLTKDMSDGEFYNFIKLYL